MEDAINVTVAQQACDINYMKEKLDSIENKLDNFINCADKKFSSKWVEKSIIWAGGIIGVIILSGLIALLVKAFVFFYK